MKLIQIRFLGIFLFLASFGLSSCTMNQSLVSGNNRSYGYTWAQEVELGKQAHQEILAEYGLYNNPNLATYVNQVAQSVLAKSHARRPETPQEIQSTQFTFSVLDSPIVNAFALPGGYIYFTRGLLAHLDNEAQLAMVIGHEIAHVTARHASIAAGRQQRAQAGVLLGTVLGAVLGASPDVLQTGQQVLSSGAGLLLLGHGREAERESDDLGMEYAALAGYKVSEGARFFNSLKRMQQTSGQQLPSFMSSHPDPGEREGTITQKGAEWEAKTNATKVNQAQLFAKIDGITVGDDPRQGFVENNVFYHPEMKFQYPTAGWTVANGAAQVQMMDSKQAAQLTLSAAKGNTAAAAAQTFAGQQGLQGVSTANTTINGFSASVVEAQAATQQGNLAVRAYFIQTNSGVLQFVGLTSAQNYPTYKAQFDQIVGGFRTLTDADKLNRLPSKLVVAKAPRFAPFMNFVTMRLANGITQEGLAIMNQVQVNQAIPAGSALKLIK